MEDKLQKAAQIIEEAIEEYKPVAIFSLFSGGHDSLSCTHFCADYLKDRLTGVVHINTGIGIEETREFVRDTCDFNNWNLLEYKAEENTYADGTPNPKIYRDIVLKHGFPGSNRRAHQWMYVQLKQRQIERLIRDFRNKRGDKCLLLSGERKQESVRRMGYNKETHVISNQIWCAPLFSFSAIEISRYVDKHNLKRNRVKDFMHISGECLCGAYSSPGELKEIELWFPKTAKIIRQLEEDVRDAGFPWGWEDSPPWWWNSHKEGQLFLDGIEPEGLMPMCVGCSKQQRA